MMETSPERLPCFSFWFSASHRQDMQAPLALLIQHS